MSDRYQFLEWVGRGSFAKVRHAKRTYDGGDVAIKEIMRSSFVRDREIYLLDRLWHRNIVNLLDIIYLDAPPPLPLEPTSSSGGAGGSTTPTPSAPGTAASGPHRNYHHRQQQQQLADPPASEEVIPLLVLDWAPITLDSLMDAFRLPFDIFQLKCFAWQLIEAVAFLHEHGIVHRDIAPSNILLTTEGIVKLSDFGSATLISSSPLYNPPRHIYPPSEAPGPDYYHQQHLYPPPQHSFPAHHYPQTPHYLQHQQPQQHPHQYRMPPPGVPTGPASTLSSSSSSHLPPSSSLAPPHLRPRSHSSVELPPSIAYFQEDGHLTPNVCTLWYRAPEILQHRDYSYPVDMWSYGCVIMELVLGRPLLPGNSEVDELDRIFRFFEGAPDGPDPALRAPILPSSSTSSIAPSAGSQNPARPSSSSRPLSSRPSSSSSSTSISSAVSSSSSSSSSHHHHHHHSHQGSRPPAHFLHTRAAYKRARPMDVRERNPQQFSAVQRLLYHLRPVSASHSSSQSSKPPSKSSTSASSSSSDTQIVPVDHNFISLMEGILTFDPDNRIYAKDAISHGFFYKEPYPCTPIELLARLNA